MVIGIPKEIKNNESRVGMTPAGVLELTHKGHSVFVQAGAGVGSGFSDEDYRKVGARILDTIGQVYAMSEMIVKVKEPIRQEVLEVKAQEGGEIQIRAEVTQFLVKAVTGCSHPPRPASFWRI